jgi:hypothetical protein
MTVTSKSRLRGDSSSRATIKAAGRREYVIFTVFTCLYERIKWVVCDSTLGFLTLSFFSPARLAFSTRVRPEPDPPTDLTGRAWAHILQLEKKILSRVRPEMLFLAILHYKMRRRPAQAWARPEPNPKIEARHVQWDGHGQIFSTRNNRFFCGSARTRPDPKMFRSI